MEFIRFFIDFTAHFVLAFCLALPIILAGGFLYTGVLIFLGGRW